MNNESFIKKIIKKGKECVFVSPHFDDAILSAGGLLNRLSKTNKVRVINVFTKAGKGDTFSAKKFLRSCGYKSAHKLFEDRDIEDKAVFNSLNIKRVNLNYRDALWRKKPVGPVRRFFTDIFPEINSVYPTYRFHIGKGKVADFDQKLINNLSRKLKKLITSKNTVVFCPLSVGDHVDHIIVRKACEKAFTGLVYWTDYPYIARKNVTDTGLSATEPVGFSYKVDKKLKLRLLRMYKTQFDALFPDKQIHLIPEKFNFAAVGYSIETVENPDPKFIDKWYALWKKCPRSHIFNSPFWYIACKLTFNYQKSKIYILKKDNKLKAVWPLVSSGKFGIPLLADPGEELADRSPLLIDDVNSAGLKLLFEKISENDTLLLRELPASTADRLIPERYFTKNLSSVNPYHIVNPDPYRYLPREQLNKINNILNKNRGGFRLTRRIGNLEKSLGKISDIDLKSSKKDRGLMVFTETDTCKLLKNLSGVIPNSVATEILYYKNDPIIYSVGFIYKKTYFTYQTAYKNDYSKLAPGKILLYKMLEDIKRNGFETVEFGRGENSLKDYFTPLKTYNYNLLVSGNYLKFLILKICDNMVSFIINNDLLYKSYCNLRKIYRLRSSVHDKTHPTVRIATSYKNNL